MYIILPLIQRTIIAGLIAFPFSTAHADTAGIPWSFDRLFWYKTYTYRHLSDYISKSVGISNEFVGDRVKFVGRYFVTNHGNKNCNDSVCKNMLAVVDIDRSAIVSAVTMEYGLPYLYLRKKMYESAGKDIERNCGNYEVCYITVAGTLREKSADFSYLGVHSIKPIAYLEVSKISVVEIGLSGFVNETAKSLLSAGKLAGKVYQYLPDGTLEVVGGLVRNQLQ